MITSHGRDLSRGEFLRLIAASIPGALLAVRAAAQSNEDERLARIRTIIQTYDSQGLHRTATPADNASAEWLAGEATRAGGEVRLAPFAIDRVDLGTNQLRAGGRTMDGVPFFDAGFTDERGLTGRLGAPGSAAEFALVRLDTAAISTEGESLRAVRTSATHRAVVAVTSGGSPGLSPSNAVSFGRPYGIPVLQVSSEHQDLLDVVAQRREKVTFVAHAVRSAGEASNVIAAVPGTRPDLPPLVVMTPRSGWLQCASERGGGLACWLEIIRALSAAKADRPALFVASSGHELGHFGLDAFLHERPALIKDAAAWFHLGANIGAANGRLRLQSSDDQLEAMAVEALESAGTSIQQRVPRGTLPGGEARNIHVGGGRYVSLLGNGPLFHNRADRWPAAVDVASVERCANACATVALMLAGAPA